mmetsp:Transcript_9541/g.20115  ORF Transcript_9541/g.20115 Transcript_9541/m.20115 type:complete len:244 (-) Transcript_9541:191-922(-)
MFLVVIGRERKRASAEASKSVAQGAHFVYQKYCTNGTIKLISISTQNTVQYLNLLFSVSCLVLNVPAALSRSIFGGPGSSLPYRMGRMRLFTSRTAALYLSSRAFTGNVSFPMLSICCTLSTFLTSAPAARPARATFVPPTITRSFAPSPHWLKSSLAYSSGSVSNGKALVSTKCTSRPVFVWSVVKAFSTRGSVLRDTTPASSKKCVVGVVPGTAAWAANGSIINKIDDIARAPAALLSVSV